MTPFHLDDMSATAAGVEAGAATLRPPGLIRLADGAASLSGVVSALGLLAMTGVICYEVFARYVFNAPTSWVAEVAAYLLVAVAFLGLAAAQRAGAHIQVELLLGVLPKRLAVELQLVANWIGLFFVLFAAWQAASFTAGEYVGGARSWGLLATPQWLPQVPLAVGFVLFALSLLADSYRLRPPERPASMRVAQLALVTLLVVLLLLGRLPVPIAGTRHDWGTLAVCLALLPIVWWWSGPRTTLAVLLTLCALGAAFWLVRGTSLLVIGLLLAGAILVFLLAGVRIALALGLVGMFGLYFLLPKPQLAVIAERAWTSVNSFTLTAVPMFVMMSSLLLRSGVTTRMYDSLVTWFGRTPGGLAHASVGASAIFAAVSGSSLATAATLGTVACPEMTRRGYSARLTYGVTAAGATLGIMIPPSIAMIIYGSTVGAPIDILFIAGIVPGLLLALGFMVGALVWALAVPGAAPKGESYPFVEKLRSLRNVLPFGAVIIAVLGSLYAGIATPTEAGAMGVAMALVLCVVFGAFSWRMLYDVAVETVGVTAFILLIVTCAAVLSWVFDYLRLPRALVETVRDAQLERWMVIALVAVIYVVLGMFVESISMMLMTLPVTFPLVAAQGFDPIWFGIFLVIMVEVGLITPPVGIVLFVLKGTGGTVSIKDIAIGALPFVGIILGFVVVMYIYPELIAWLPSKVR
jgi:tripartite ATP-independent transporter DctM subunit